jgi:hypothetical protein
MSCWKLLPFVPEAHVLQDGAVHLRAVHILHGDHLPGVTGPHDAEGEGPYATLLLVHCGKHMETLSLRSVGHLALQSFIQMSLLRVHTDLRTQVVDAPEVLTIIDSMPELSQFLNSLYNCQYHEFFKVCTP